mgnify:CR=1 FL=1
MSKVLDELLALLALEKIEEGLFRGQSQDLGLRAVFGGQVMGQALSAAKETIPEDRKVHSFHSYFLRPGDASRPIVYEVENIRDGKSFSTRRVSAIRSTAASAFTPSTPEFGAAPSIPASIRPSGSPPCGPR